MSANICQDPIREFFCLTKFSVFQQKLADHCVKLGVSYEVGFGYKFALLGSAYLFKGVPVSSLKRAADASTREDVSQDPKILGQRNLLTTLALLSKVGM